MGWGLLFPGAGVVCRPPSPVGFPPRLLEKGDGRVHREARAGQTFLLGASTWRIEEITRDRVLVSPAPGLPGAVPFWKGEGVGRPYELGEKIGAASRELVACRVSEMIGGVLWPPRAGRGICGRFYTGPDGAHPGAGVPGSRAKRRAARVKPDEIATLVAAIRDVLREAIKAGGSSLRDHKRTDGELGYFQHHFRVYDREGEPCVTPRCGGTVKRIVQNGRSTYFCPVCQK